MFDTPSFPPKNWSELAAFLEATETRAIIDGPEFQRGLDTVAREVAELAERRRQASIIREDVRHQLVSI